MEFTEKKGDPTQVQKSELDRRAFFSSLASPKTWQNLLSGSEASLRGANTSQTAVSSETATMASSSGAATGLNTVRQFGGELLSDGINVFLGRQIAKGLKELINIRAEDSVENGDGGRGPGLRGDGGRGPGFGVGSYFGVNRSLQTAQIDGFFADSRNGTFPKVLEAGGLRLGEGSRGKFLWRSGEPLGILGSDGQGAGTPIFMREPLALLAVPRRQGQGSVVEEEPLLIFESLSDSLEHPRSGFRAILMQGAAPHRVKAFWDFPQWHLDRVLGFNEWGNVFIVAHHAESVATTDSMPSGASESPVLLEMVIRQGPGAGGLDLLERCKLPRGSLSVQWIATLGRRFEAVAWGSSGLFHYVSSRIVDHNALQGQKVGLLWEWSGEEYSNEECNDDNKNSLWSQVWSSDAVAGGNAGENRIINQSTVKLESPHQFSILDFSLIGDARLGMQGRRVLLAGPFGGWELREDATVTKQSIFQNQTTQWQAKQWHWHGVPLGVQSISVTSQLLGRQQAGASGAGSLKRFSQIAFRYEHGSVLGAANLSNVTLSQEAPAVSCFLGLAWSASGGGFAGISAVTGYENKFYLIYELPCSTNEQKSGSDRPAGARRQALSTSYAMDCFVVS